MNQAPETSIRLLWLPQAQFAGYLLAERDSRNSSTGLRIRCEPASSTVGPAKAVLSGDCDFAVASPSHILESDSSEDLVWLLTIQQESPLVYPVWRDSGIETPSHLDGRSVAVWPGNDDLEFQWMLKRAGLDPSRVARVPVQDTVAAFLDRRADSAQMTCYHELHVLGDHLEEESAVRLFRAADYGAGLIKDGLIARRDFVERNATMTQDLVTAVLEGWVQAFTNPEAALQACLEARPDMSLEAHAQQLDDIRVLAIRGATLSHGLGYPDPAHASSALQAAAEVGLPESGLAAEEMTLTRDGRDRHRRGRNRRRGHRPGAHRPRP